MIVVYFVFIIFQFVLSSVVSVLTPWWRAGYTFEESQFAVHFARWIGVHANFDGVHYMKISSDGYALYQHAFFPLYPALMHVVNLLTKIGPFFAGLIISLVSFWVVVFVWDKVFRQVGDVQLRFGRYQVSRALLLLLISPCAFFFTTIYTESLFMALLGAYVYAILNKKYFFAAVIGYFLGLTRFAGFFVFLIPLVIAIYDYLKTKHVSPRSLLPIISPGLGLVTYMLYLWYTIGQPLEFIYAQRGFGNSRSTSIILLPQVLYRYIKILLLSKVDFGYFVAVFELGMFLLVFATLAIFLYRLLVSVRKSKPFFQNMDRNGVVMVALVTFSFANLILPSLSGTLGSIPRYVLASIALPLLISKTWSSKLRWAYVGISILLHIASALSFYLGYFVS